MSDFIIVIPTYITVCKLKRLQTSISNIKYMVNEFIVFSWAQYVSLLEHKYYACIYLFIFYWTPLHNPSS